MKSLSILLAVSLFIAELAQAQSRPPATKKPFSISTTTRSATKKPASATVITRSSMVRPVTAPTATSASSQQSQYDQYHGVAKKPAAAPTPSVAPDGRQASRPAPKPAPTKPTPPTPADRAAERPATSSGNSSGIRIGIRGGATYPVYTEKLVGATSAVGFVGGFVVNVGRGLFSFQPELNYARYAVNAEGVIGNPAINVAADKFEVPLFLKIASGSANSNRFFLNIGPYGAYLSGASINGQHVALDNSTGRFSFGAAAGVGAALKAGPGHLTIELRGLYELGDAQNKVNTDSRVINTQATLGYMIPLGGH